MSSVIEALNEVAPNVSNETLGRVAAEFVKTGSLDADALGRIIRPSLGSMVTTTASEAMAATKSSEVPTVPAARAELLDTIYNAFNGDYNRRSVSALSRATGLSGPAVLELLEGNADFEVATRRSGKTYVTLRGMN